MIKTFEDLDCWKLAAELRRAIIAEGYGRYHYQEYMQFCRQSRGSLYEIIDHLLVAQEENYITQNHFQNLKEQVVKCVTVLNGFINYLDRAKTKLNLINDPKASYDIDDSRLTINQLK